MKKLMNNSHMMMNLKNYNFSFDNSFFYFYIDFYQKKNNNDYKKEDSDDTTYDSESRDKKRKSSSSSSSSDKNSTLYSNVQRTVIEELENLNFDRLIYIDKKELKEMCMILENTTISMKEWMVQSESSLRQIEKMLDMTIPLPGMEE